MSKTPLWKSIAETLKSEIAERQLRPGDKLATEAEMAKRFAVNRHTVRQAIKSLVDVGLVRTRRGAGAFVAAKLLDYPITNRVRFHQNMLAAGQAPLKETLQIELRGATTDEAARLDLIEGDALCIYHGLSSADNVPIALFSSAFPLARLPGVDAALAKETSVTKALNRCGVADYTRASTRVSARMADAIQALHLDVPEGAALIYTTSINVDANDVPIEFGKTWFAGDRVTLTLEDNGL